MTPTPPRQIALIGAGRRMTHNFLPALRALGDDWQVQGITSRRLRTAPDVGRRWDVPVVDAIAAFDWDRIDIAVVSVTTRQVPNVLRQLEPYGAGLDLVLDTPPFAGPLDLRWARLFRAFRRVAVAEDFMRFPQFDRLRAAVDAGAVGRPERVVLHRTGFLYHGLALARSFFDFDTVRSFRSTPGPGGGRDVRYDLRGGGTVKIIGPYQPRDGEVSVVGSDGTRVAGDLAHADPPVLAALRAMDLEDGSDFNLAKTCGTAAVLQQLTTPDVTPYGPADAIYDTVVSSLAARLPVGVDPGGALRTVAWRLLDRQRPSLSRQ